MQINGMSRIRLNIGFESLGCWERPGHACWDRPPLRRAVATAEDEVLICVVKVSQSVQVVVSSEMR